MKVLRLINTVKYLKFIQVYYRLHYLLLKPRTKQTVFDIQLRNVFKVWLNIVLKPPSMLSPTQFVFLNQLGSLNNADDWNTSQQEKLWLYNLHYFDDLNAENAIDRKDWHGNLINKWIDENPYSIGNGWEAYPSSLRIVNWIKWSLSGNELNEKQLNSLCLQTQHLSKNLEWHVLANHLFANAKALIFSGLFFNTAESDVWLKKGIKIYNTEIKEQVLLDGGNYELTPMYHSIFIEDLLDIYHILFIYNKLDLIDTDYLIKVINKMLFWLKKMSHPDGDISFFNDAAFGIAPKYSELVDYAKYLDIYKENCEAKDIYLEESGYISIERERLKLIFDVAKVGPDYQPGHGHADSLSFELSLWGQRFIVNSGISKYGTDNERVYQRSTKAHNAIVIDNKNSSEIWSGFRVARRVIPYINFIEKNENKISAFSASYKNLNNVIVKRDIKILDNIIIIDDYLEGKFISAFSYLHFHPDCTFISVKDNNIEFLLNGRRVFLAILGSFNFRLIDTSYYPNYGRSVRNKSLEIELLSNKCKLEIKFD